MERTTGPEWLVVQRQRRLRSRNSVRAYGASALLVLALAGLLQIIPGADALSPLIWAILFAAGSLFAIYRWVIGRKGTFGRALAGHLALLMFIFASVATTMWALR